MKRKILAILLSGILGAFFYMALPFGVSAVSEEDIFNQLLEKAGQPGQVTAEKIVPCIHITDIVSPKQTFAQMSAQASCRAAVLEEEGEVIGCAKFSRDIYDNWELAEVWEDKIFLDKQIWKYGNEILYIDGLANDLFASIMPPYLVTPVSTYLDDDPGWYFDQFVLYMSYYNAVSLPRSYHRDNPESVDSLIYSNYFSDMDLQRASVYWKQLADWGGEDTRSASEAVREMMKKNPKHFRELLKTEDLSEVVLAEDLGLYTAGDKKMIERRLEGRRELAIDIVSEPNISLACIRNEGRVVLASVKGRPVCAFLMQRDNNSIWFPITEYQGKELKSYLHTADRYSRLAKPVKAGYYYNNFGEAKDHYFFDAGKFQCLCMRQNTGSLYRSEQLMQHWYDGWAAEQDAEKDDRVPEGEWKLDTFRVEGLGTVTRKLWYEWLRDIGIAAIPFAVIGGIVFLRHKMFHFGVRRTRK